MAKNDNLPDFLKDVADAIREVEDTTDLINPQNFSSKIREQNLNNELTQQENLLNELETQVNELPEKDVDLSETTATAEDVKEGKEFYNASGEKVAGTYKDMLQARVDANNSCDYLFYYYRSDIELPLDNLDTSNVTTMKCMFYECTKIKKINLSNFNTSNVTDMSFMFRNCQSLISNIVIPLDLSNFDTSNVTNMSYMFNSCGSLQKLDLSSFDTSNVADMSYMFYYCNQLASLDISSFNTSSVTNMNSMFYSCNKLQQLDLSGFNTSNVTNMNSMFYNCSRLENIIGTLDMIKATNITSMFSGCSFLKTIRFKNIKKSLGLNSSDVLTDDTIINVFQELHDLTGKTAQTLYLYTTPKARIEAIYVKLIDVTDEMRAEDQYIDSKKPCVVCESTDEGAMTLKEYGISKNWNIAS